MKTNPFIEIVNSTILCLQKYSNKRSLESQFQEQGIIHRLKDLRFEELSLVKGEQVIKGIGYRNILQKKGLRITLYYLPQGVTIKLHNHPSMLVATYIIKGKVQANVYSPTATPFVFNKETLTLEMGSASFIDGLRTNNKNLHELRAIEDTYFLDILFPDYDEKRECSFFEEELQISENSFQLKLTSPDQLEFFKI